MVRQSIASLSVTALLATGCDQQPVDKDVEPISEITESPDSASEVVFGRWCDRMVPNLPEYWVVLEIVSSGNRTVKRMIDRNGNVTEFPLIEKSGNLYAQENSPSGDSYRIVPNNGELQSVDNDGLIRTASRLENQPTPGEC